MERIKIYNYCQKIVQYIIKFWGKGKLIAKKNNFYEQANLQLNISKAKKYLKWRPTYSIKESVKITVDWYYQVLQQKNHHLKLQTIK